MYTEVQHNDPGTPPTGTETVEFTFWFELSGTHAADDVCDAILEILERADIEGVRYRNTFRGPFAKLYSDSR